MPRIIKYYEALSEAFIQAMDADPDIFMMGIAVDYPSGIFGSTTEVFKKFGSSRVFDTPAMENALTGIAIGASLMGKRPIVVHPRNDFMFLGFDQMINVAAKWKYMFDGNAGRVPILVRAIIGKGWGQGATHSQSLQAPLAHFPGLTVVMPTMPDDAKSLVLFALQHDGPVVMLEHRSLYNVEGEVPEVGEPAEYGKARTLREGKDITIVGTSYMAYEALHAADALSEQGIDAEVIDLRFIRPLDEETILKSIEKTGHLLVTDTSWEMCGVTSEVAALAAEKAFSALKSPVRRIALANCPSPVSMPLESAFYPKASTIAEAVTEMLNGEQIELGHIDRADHFKGPY